MVSADVTGGVAHYATGGRRGGGVTRQQEEDDVRIQEIGEGDKTHYSVKYIFISCKIDHKQSIFHIRISIYLPITLIN